MSDNKSPRTEGRVAAAASGTGFLGMISFIPNETVRQILIYAAPSLTVAFGWGWIVGRSKMIRWLNGRELDSALARAERVRDDILSDPNSSEEMKSNAIQAVADLQRLKIQAIKDDYLRIHADLTGRG